MTGERPKANASTETVERAGLILLLWCRVDRVLAQLSGVGRPVETTPLPFGMSHTYRPAALLRQTCYWTQTNRTLNATHHKSQTSRASCLGFLVQRSPSSAHGRSSGSSTSVPRIPHSARAREASNKALLLPALPDFLHTCLSSLETRASRFFKANRCAAETISRYD
ncbi:hypothetical protein BJX68DRAFT_245745 [Aspergillus pseudodeflectus]|uniref:Uncharacterized protein n=1 Tax=Aspergillus pseudodeflectus TaxID=176178 RepID=A0ABR4JMT4_9EURO